MEQFMEALKQNLIINQLTLNLVLTDDELYEKFRSLKALRFDSNLPIYYLPFLKNVEAIQISNYISSMKEEEIDYSALNNFPELKTLIITHNSNIKKLDISNLKKLSNLILVANENLEELIGLDKIKNMNKIIIVGNDIRKIDNILDVLNNNTNCEMLKLDVNLYHFLVEQEINLSKYNVSFAEKISVGELYSLDLKMMSELYGKGLQILSGIIDKNMDDYTKAKKIYEFIVKRLKYDYDNLALRNDYVYSHEIGIFNNDYKDINTSYKALNDYKVVCEGYANLFKFLLNIEGIISETIVCFYKENGDNFEYFNHTANKIKIGDEWYYCDSQLETDSNNLKYFMKTRKEFEETHKLPIEKKVDRSTLK